jgi:DNA-binding response OmpR family regulator
VNRPELRVLLIEDEENDYILVKDLLSDISSTRFHLDWISSYEEAVAEICRLHHDVYLLDYRLGVRGGLELLREVMGKGCNVPVILLTGQGDYGVDIKAMMSGAADYLVKNQINADLLERSIRYS